MELVTGDQVIRATRLFYQQWASVYVILMRFDGVLLIRSASRVFTVLNALPSPVVALASGGRERSVCEATKTGK